MRYIYVTIWLCALLCLSSCIHPQQLENLGVILSRGVDKSGEEDIELTMAILQFQKDTPSATKTISGTGKTVKGAVDDANKRANQEIVIGKIDLEIYGKEIAEAGLHPYTDTLRRDANIPSTLLLAVADSKAKDIFNVQEETIDTNLGEYLHGLLEPGVEQRLFPAIQFPKFAYAIKNPGIEPVLPTMGMRDGIPTITGLAIFKGDKMVGQLSLADAQLYKLIEGTVSDEYMEITLPIDPLSEFMSNRKEIEKKDDINIIFIIEKGRGTTSLTSKENLKFDTNVELILNLQEISESYHLDDKKAIQKLEKEVEKKIKKKFETILAKLKELNSDVFGYGVLYRIQNKDGKLKDEEWDKLFPKIDVNFNVKVKIIRHGEVHR
ncbi:Ger(x)C family spore germination protein [Paucisalibacillus globulus]|uniref:Ger(x)C family spore germination protein n=1 Tax=Paucisalibacillus globulus TaxID=351095 RepID=UPI00047B7AF5|nr:Ger(x)C family spore germination protein [Paucisalibacillus globulus]